MALAVSNFMELCYGTRSFPQLIDLPGAWQGNQFSDESEYVYHLNSSEIDEVKNALLYFKGKFPVDPTASRI